MKKLLFLTIIILISFVAGRLTPFKTKSNQKEYTSVSICDEIITKVDQKVEPYVEEMSLSIILCKWQFA